MPRIYKVITSPIPVGGRYGLLVNKQLLSDGPRAKRIWLCQCDCGASTQVKESSLLEGNTRSCGCLQKSKVRMQGYRNATHGDTKSQEYKTWASVIGRTENKNNTEVAE
jgi:hypothetical protein